MFRTPLTIAAALVAVAATATTMPAAQAQLARGTVHCTVVDVKALEVKLACIPGQGMPTNINPNALPLILYAARTDSPTKWQPAKGQGADCLYDKGTTRDCKRAERPQA